MSSIKIQKREGKVKVASKAAFVFNPRGESMPKKDRKNRVMVDRAPVLTLWAAVVAEVLGFEHDKALTLGRAVAVVNPCCKQLSLRLFQPTPKEAQEQRRKMRKEESVTVALLHRAVPAKNTEKGLLAPS
jgi:hypothetical protein